ncbi:MAG: flippase-like domain-containing protein [Prevotella sp.]|nr:flippase-like domain-containing protein [Prevotella sp.]MCR5152966.1 flippase-like domain-containing protein [Prevotella sp.]
MDKHKLSHNIINVALPLVLGGGILYWMYRNFDFSTLMMVVTREMDWTWMLLSFPFGILAQMFRAWRWKQVLEPIGEKPRTSTSIYSIFISYAVSLIIPRIGEIARCGILKRYDGVSFPKAIGTVVTERAVDTLLMLMITAIALLAQMSVFGVFFDKTGTRMDTLLGTFSTTGWAVTALCALAAICLTYIILKRLSVHQKIKDTLKGIWQGVTSLRQVRNLPLFLFYSIGIWGCYFLHYYLTFFCFDFTKDLGLTCGLVTFVVGTIAVIVPTPNGAGPWHFAVKTMLVLYGLSDTNALYFVLIVHTVQTLLVVLLGIIGTIGVRKRNVINN